MKIGIIGTGNMAKGFVTRLETQSLPLLLGARDQAKASALSGAFRGVEVDGIANVVRASDVIIPALPYEQVLALLPTLGDLTGKILLDISNPITSDFRSLTIGFTSSAAEEIQKQARGALVVKAFNTIFAQVFELDREQTRDTQVFYATDHVEAAERAAAFIRAVGFKPIHAGPLSNARYLEPLGEMNIHFGYMLGRGAAIAPYWQSLSDKEFT